MPMIYKKKKKNHKLFDFHVWAHTKNIKKKKKKKKKRQKWEVPGICSAMQKIQ